MRTYYFAVFFLIIIITANYASEIKPNNIENKSFVSVCFNKAADNDSLFLQNYLDSLHTDELNDLKIGLALSGGSARGLAHIGVLKAFDELNIQIDYIAGTSMGGLIGAYYSLGFSPDEIENTLKNYDLNNLSTDEIDRKKEYFFVKDFEDITAWKFRYSNLTLKIPEGFVNGQNIMSLLAKDLSLLNTCYNQNFDKYPVPLRVVATDLTSGKAVSFKNGNIHEIIRGSIGFPPIFKPYKIKNMNLVDGGILQNLPVQTVLDMGADIVFAVDVSDVLSKKKEYDDMISVINDAINVFMKANTKYDKKNTILFRPDLKNFSGDDFDSIDELIHIGKDYSLKKLKKMIPSPKKQNFVFPEIVLNPNFEDIDSNKLEKYLYSSKIKTLDEIKTKTNVFLSKNVDKGYCVSDVCKKKNSYEINIERLIIDSISVLGCNSINKNIVLRELDFKQGDQFDAGKLQNSIQNIYGSKLFKFVTYNILSYKNQHILEIKVKEEYHGRIVLGLKYDTNEKTKAYMRIGYDNVFREGIKSYFQILVGKKLSISVNTQVDRINNSHLTFYLKSYYSKDGFFRYKIKEKSEYTEFVRDENFGISIGFGEQSYQKIGRIIAAYDYENHNWFSHNDWSSYDLSKYKLLLDYDSLDDMPFPTKGIKREVELVYSRVHNKTYDYSYVRSKNSFFVTFKPITLKFYGLFQYTNQEIPPSDYFRNSAKEVNGYLEDELNSQEISLAELSARLTLQRYSNDPRNAFYLSVFINNYKNKNLKFPHDLFNVLANNYNIRYGAKLTLDTKIGIINFFVSKDDWKRNYYYFFIGQYF